MGKKPKSNDKSPGRDSCQTPFYALEPLLIYLPRSWVIWEPAAGENLLAGYLYDHCADVISGDLLTGRNYFDDRWVPSHYDAQVTNPPYSIKYDWLERAYKLQHPFALIMPIDTLGSGQAQRLFDKHGVEILLLDKRVDYKMPNSGWGGKGAQFNSAWFTWGLNIGRSITYCRLNKPRKNGSLPPPIQARLSKPPYQQMPMFT